MQQSAKPVLMPIEITRKTPHIISGATVDDRPHVYRDLPRKFPDGYYQLVHPRWSKGHNLVRNATLAGHLEDAADLVDRGYRLRMSEGGNGSSPDLVRADELCVRR